MRTMVPLAALLLLLSSCSYSSHRQEAGPSAEADREAYVLAPDEGEVLMLHSERGPITIKVSPQTGSPRTAMGTQKLAPRAQIPVHVHHSADEVLFIHRGTGIGRIGQSSAELEAGSTIFIPSGVWLGLRVRTRTWNSSGTLLLRVSTSSSRTWTAPQTRARAN